MTKDTDPISDALSLEKLSGLGPSSIKALNKENIFSTFQLKHKNPTWLKEVTGYDKEKCGQIFAELTKKLLAVNLIDPQEMSATEALAQRNTVRRIKIDCPAVDGLLGGGLECGCITEFYGENGGGKTQTSHTFAVQVQRPVADGGLQEDGKAPPIVFFIATENTFRPERIISIASGKGLISDIPQILKTKVAEGKTLSPEEQTEYDAAKAKQATEAEKYLDNIIVSRVSDAVALCKKVEDLIRICQEVPIKLIILDSGTALFRAHFLGLGNMKSKFDLMNEMIQNLLAIAEYNKVAIIFVNQIYHDPDAKMGADEVEPYGGNVLGHAIPYRMKVMKSGTKHRMTIMKSPYQPNDSVRFDVVPGGLADVVIKSKKDLEE